MARAKTNSEKLWKKAQRYMPGGVNSPVRAFKGVGGSPIFVERGKGANIWDVDGKKYVDHVCSWGPLILGHAEKEVSARLKKVISLGTSFGIPTDRESELARMVIRAVESFAGLKIPLLGVVINRVGSQRDSSYYGYGYDYATDYGNEDAPIDDPAEDLPLAASQ